MSRLKADVQVTIEEPTQEEALFSQITIPRYKRE